MAYMHAVYAPDGRLVQVGHIYDLPFDHKKQTIASMDDRKERWRAFEEAEKDGFMFAIVSVVPVGQGQGANALALYAPPGAVARCNQRMPAILRGEPTDVEMLHRYADEPGITAERLLKMYAQTYQQGEGSRGDETIAWRDFIEPAGWRILPVLVTKVMDRPLGR